jgi:hypothetical protein
VFWDRILDAICEAGISVVATFFCWEFHEIERGRFDLTGETAPERDVDAFMRACVARELKVFARPGPIIDSEWPSRGPSADLATLERTDPRFRDRATGWTRAISAKLAEHQQPHGPVAYVQIDNEIFYPHFTEVSATEADSAIQIPFDPDRILADLRAWREQPGELAPELLQALPGFPDDPAPRFAELPLAHRLLAFEFTNSVVDGYLRWVHQEMRASGIAVPITTNVKQSCAYLDAARFDATVEEVGFNYYLEHLETPEQLQVGHWWAGLARTELRRPWAPEFWCGRWMEEDADTRVFKEDHYRYIVLCTLALGFRQLNLFMAVDRDDWHYAAFTGLGKPRAAARALTSLRAVFDAIEPDERLADVGLLWTRPHHQAFVAERFRDWKEPSGIWVEQAEPKESAAWWSSLAAIVDGDQDLTLLSSEAEVLAAPCVIYAGPSWAEQWVAPALARRLEEGRPVLFSGEVPLDDLAGERRGDAGNLAELAQQAIHTTPEQLPSALERAGIFPWVSTGGELVSTAYRRRDGSVWLFLVNRRAAPVRCPLTMRPELRAATRRQLAGPDPFLDDDTVALPGRTVALVELVPARGA